MEYKNIYEDFYYTFGGDVMSTGGISYRIEDENGVSVFSGKAYGLRPRVNVAQKIRDHLFNHIDDFREADGETFDHLDAIHAYSLIIDGTVAEQWMVLYSWKPWDGQLNFLTTVINNHASPRQKLFFTNAQPIDAPEDSIDIDDGGGGDGPGGDGGDPPFVPPGDYSGDYLTVRFLEDATVRFQARSGSEISVDGGEFFGITATQGIWTDEYTFTAGQTVRFAEYLLNGHDSGQTTNSKLMQTGALFDAWGNVYSISHRHSFRNSPYILGTKDLSNVFYGLRVRDASQVVMPSDLRNDNLCPGCDGAGLWWFFKDCTELVKAPPLPATSVPNLAYESMFEGCTSLVKAPELPATSVGQSAYIAMFKDCTSLTTPPPTIGVTTAYAYMCNAMFNGCTSLTKAPTLPATTLEANCYSYMFAGCSSLKKAPSLPARTVTNFSYAYMFYNCTALREIRISATSFGSDWGMKWIHGVGGAGDFYGDASVGWQADGEYVPLGWTVHSL